MVSYCDESSALPRLLFWLLINEERKTVEGEILHAWNKIRRYRHVFFFCFFFVLSRSQFRPDTVHWVNQTLAILYPDIFCALDQRNCLVTFAIF